VTTDSPLDLTSVFNAKWVESAADALVSDLQRNLHWRAVCGSVPDGIRDQEPGWCFDRPSHTVHEQELEVWRYVLKHPAMLRGALSDWANRSLVIENCLPPRASLERFGLTTSDVLCVIRELARESGAIREFVLDVTKQFVDCSADDCGRETFLAGSAAVAASRAQCVASLGLELMICVLPGPGMLDRARRTIAVCAEIPLSWFSTQLVIADFPSHTLVLDQNDSPPVRTLVSVGGDSPGCVRLDVTDEDWQVRRDYLEATRVSARLYQQQMSNDEVPTHEALNTEPVHRSLPLSALTLRIHVRGAPDYQRNAASRLSPSVRGAFKAVDFGLLADERLRAVVFSSILISVRRGGGRGPAASSKKRLPEFLGLGGHDWSAMDAYFASDSHWQAAERFRMRSAWVEFMPTATAEVDESALRPMLEMCLAQPVGGGSRRGAPNPIAKGLGDLDRASQLLDAQPRDALVVAVTALESTVLWRLPKPRDGVSAPKKNETLQRRIAILFGCDSDEDAGLVRRWVRDIYNVRSEVVHGESVTDDDAVRAASAALFLAGVCMLKLSASVRFRARIGAVPTSQSCDSALVDFWSDLDRATEAAAELQGSRSGSDVDPRIDHFGLAGWPARMLQVKPRPSR
jgi:hypothetical protein